LMSQLKSLGSFDFQFFNVLNEEDSSVSNLSKILFQQIVCLGSF